MGSLPVISGEPNFFSGMRLIEGDLEELDAKRYLEEVMGVIDDHEDNSTSGGPTEVRRRNNKKKKRSNVKSEPLRSPARPTEKKGRSCCSKVVFTALMMVFLTSVGLLAIDYPNGEYGQQLKSYIQRADINVDAGQLVDLVVSGATWTKVKTIVLCETLRNEGVTWIANFDYAQTKDWLLNQMSSVHATCLTAYDTWSPTVTKMARDLYADSASYLGQAIAVVQENFPFLHPPTNDPAGSSPESLLPDSGRPQARKPKKEVKADFIEAGLKSGRKEDPKAHAPASSRPGEQSNAQARPASMEEAKKTSVRPEEPRNPKPAADSEAKRPPVRSEEPRQPQPNLKKVYPGSEHQRKSAHGA